MEEQRESARKVNEQTDKHVGESSMNGMLDSLKKVGAVRSCNREVVCCGGVEKCVAVGER